jgi:hypothetical protein
LRTKMLEVGDLLIDALRLEQDLYEDQGLASQLNPTTTDSSGS